MRNSRLIWILTTIVTAALPLLGAGPAAARPAAAGPAATTGWWHPIRGLTWQWQLTGTIDLSVNAQVYDVDAVDTPAATVAALHQAGRKAICYVDAGSWERWRPDAARFPASVLGNTMDGWPDERWLDIRRTDLLRPILADRFALCRQKGFDGVEADNVDGYDNDTGFGLTGTDQLTYNRMLADLAHSAGLAIGLKNDLDQVTALAPVFDFGVNEQCAQYSECGVLKTFTSVGKPVFHAEYSLATSTFCSRTTAIGLSSIRKRLSLDAWRQAC